MPLLSTIGAAAARAFGFLRSLVAGGYEIDNSLRFNSGSSDYLAKALTGVDGNRQIWTFSSWVKRAKLGTAQTIFSFSENTSAEGQLYFDTNDFLVLLNDGQNGSTNETDMKFRDVGAWYHIVWACDSTQATNANRWKVYVNGTQVTLTGSPTITLNGNGIINAWAAHDCWLGASARSQQAGNPAQYADIYLSETYFIDGQQLTPSSFGETDEDSGIWKPKAYTGTFGTNGFYLDFEDSANLGNDMSGNNNDFTVNNLTSVDQSTDTPTNNFCTLNFIQNGNGTTSTLTEGNLVASGADNKGVAANFGVNRGKWYWEIKTVGSTYAQRVGVSNRANEQDGDASPGTDTANVRSWCGTGVFKNYTASSGSSNASFVSTNGAIYGLALDLDNGTLGRYVNGVLINTDTTLPSDNSITFFPFTFVTFSGVGGWNQAQFNFGSPMYTGGSYADANGYGNFSYAVPSGYYALCTKNLAEYA